MKLQPIPRRALYLLIGVAAFVTWVDAVKPLHIDDPFIYRIAEQITLAPTDPYGFDIFWLQWPQPVFEELTPPVLPYWWSLALAVAPQSAFVWKVWLLPFILALCLALYSLARRFAPGFELPVVLAVMLSPAFLPAVNVMQDVPALALGLTALALFLRATTGDRPLALPVVALAGLCAGLATQTKYTAVASLGALALWGLLQRSRRGATLAVVVAVGLALVVFFGWEAVLYSRYGHSMFFGQVRFGLYWFPRGSMIVPLLQLLGGTLPAVLLLALAGLGVPASGVRSLAVLTVGAFGLLVFRPFEAPLFLVLGIALMAALGMVAWRLLARSAERPALPDLFLLGWFMIELAVFFLAAPFPAVRRVMGLAIVAALVAARAVALRAATGKGPVEWRWPVAAGTVLGLLFAVVDHREATAQRDAVPQALDIIHAQDAAATVWFVGHWGFQHYAEAAGLEPVVPDVSILRRGDWLLIPQPIHRQDVAFSAADLQPAGIVSAAGGLPLTTGIGYYAGSLPLAHLPGSRLETTIYRVRHETVLRTNWDPGQLADWARMAGGRTAAAALPALVHALAESSSVGRRQAAVGLGYLGPRGGPAVPALRMALTDPDADVREAAASALAAIGAE